MVWFGVKYKWFGLVLNMTGLVWCEISMVWFGVKYKWFG